MDVETTTVTLDRVLIALACGGATFAVLKQFRTPAGILAAVLSWLFSEHAVYVAGAVLTLLVITNLTRGRTEKATMQAARAAGDGQVIDAEFEVVGERREPWTRSSDS